jgi:hypothetical protein
MPSFQMSRYHHSVELLTLYDYTSILSLFRALFRDNRQNMTPWNGVLQKLTAAIQGKKFNLFYYFFASCCVSIIKSTQFQPSMQQFFINSIPLHVSTPSGHLQVLTVVFNCFSYWITMLVVFTFLFCVH